MNGATIASTGASAICPPPGPGRHRDFTATASSTCCGAHQRQYGDMAHERRDSLVVRVPRTVSTVWSVVQTGDYNGDARAIFSGATPAAIPRCGS